MLYGLLPKPTRLLGCAAHLVASIQAFALRGLASAAHCQAIRGGLGLVYLVGFAWAIAPKLRRWVCRKAAPVTGACQRGVGRTGLGTGLDLQSSRN